MSATVIAEESSSRETEIAHEVAFSNTAWIGQSIRRKEDPRLLSGAGHFIDDLRFPRMLHAAILRSPYAHARIIKISSENALKSDGVVAVLTGEAVAKMIPPKAAVIPIPIKFHPIAVDKVRYIGEPVVVVAAETREKALDALDLIEVEYDPIEAVVDAEKAMRPDAPILYEDMGTNILWRGSLSYGDLEASFHQASYIIKERLVLHSYSSTPLEPHGCIASWEPSSGFLSIWSNTQSPGRSMESISETLKIPGHKFRLMVPSDNGGGFGIKSGITPYVFLVSLMSMKIGRPVKYVEDRQEHLLAGGHSCGQIFYVEAAVKKDGLVDALKIREIDNDGAAGELLAYHITNKLNNLTNTYKIRNIMLEGYSVTTNTCPVAANRGVGKPGMCFIWERMMDIIAKKIGMDPIEIRMRNYVEPEKFPYLTPNGNLLDSGDYQKTLRIALDAISYNSLRNEQKELRKKGIYIGVGIATGTEPGGSNLARHYIITKKIKKAGAHEGATIKMDPTGKVIVFLGTVAQGQGHETTTAQIVADELGLDPSDVNVLGTFDSFTNPWTSYSGAWGNNFSCTGVGAIVGAARRIRERIAKIAGHMMNEDVGNLRLSKGTIYVSNKPEKSISFTEIASAAYGNPHRMPDSIMGIQETFIYSYPYADLPDEHLRMKSQFTHSNSAHIAVVKIDPESGTVRVIRYVVVCDGGKMINPMIVEGQIQGSTAHGIAAAFQEEFKYAEDGQALCSSFMDYLAANSLDTPNIEVFHQETPSPFTELGTKGVGEGGAIPSPSAICNAVEDALMQFDTKISNLPLTPEKIWGLMGEKSKGEITSLVA